VAFFLQKQKTVVEEIGYRRFLQVICVDDLGSVPSSLLQAFVKCHGVLHTGAPLLELAFPGFHNRRSS
jgi:hypothetical protein